MEASHFAQNGSRHDYQAMMFSGQENEDVTCEDSEAPTPGVAVEVSFCEVVVQNRKKQLRFGREEVDMESSRSINETRNRMWHALHGKEPQNVLQRLNIKHPVCCHLIWGDDWLAQWTVGVAGCAKVPVLATIHSSSILCGLVLYRLVQ